MDVVQLFLHVNGLDRKVDMSEWRVNRPVKPSKRDSELTRKDSQS